jgi:cytochrome P450
VASREDGVGMTDTQLRDEVVTLVLAGHETTAMLLTWTWWLLSTHPDAGDRMRDELDAVLGGDAAGVDDIARLPNTRAVLAESLRLYPPAWTLGRRLLEDVEVDGWRLPRGSQVLASQWVLHRDPRFWDEAGSFRPQRWLSEAGGYDEAAPGQPRGAWFPFGWGNRRCIGDQFALTEAVLVLATLAQRWVPETTIGYDADVSPAVTLRPRHGMPAVLRRR